MRFNTPSRRGFFAKALTRLGGICYLSKGTSPALASESIAAAPIMPIVADDWQHQAYVSYSDGELTVDNYTTDYTADPAAFQYTSPYIVHFPGIGTYEVIRRLD